MTHRDAVCHRDGAELARRAARLFHALLRDLGLALERDVAWRGLVPGRYDADERTVNLLLRQAHRIVIGPVRRARRPFRHVAAGSLALSKALTSIAQCLSLKKAGHLRKSAWQAPAFGGKGISP